MRDDVFYDCGWSTALPQVSDVHRAGGPQLMTSSNHCSTPMCGCALAAVVAADSGGRAGRRSKCDGTNRLQLRISSQHLPSPVASLKQAMNVR